MKPTDFAYYINIFLTSYLAGQRNLSKNTIQSYRDTFVLLLGYLSDTNNIVADKVSINTLTKEIIENFLFWIEESRGSSISTRNQRLAEFMLSFDIFKQKN